MRKNLQKNTQKCPKIFVKRSKYPSNNLECPLMSISVRWAALTELFEEMIFYYDAAILFLMALHIKSISSFHMILNPIWDNFF